MRTKTFRRLMQSAITAGGVATSVPLSAQPSASPHPSSPTTADLSEPPLWGDKDGLIYLRDPNDLVRLYPHAELDLDANWFLGMGTSTLGANEAGVDLGSRFFVRHSRFGLAGELFKRINFDVSFDLLANPAVDGAQVDGREAKVALVDAWGSVSAGRGLSLRMGVFQAPFSLENMTVVSDLALMERNVATRFAVPGAKVLGVAFSSTSNRKMFRWDAGVFGGESLAPGRFERGTDFIGRLGVRPVPNASNAWRGLQFGFSFRAGGRIDRDTTGSLGAITSAQGFALWRPTRVAADGRSLHVMPSDWQFALGPELWVPISGFVLRSEAFWIHRSTRETLNAPQAGLSESRGKLEGLAWYAEISAWPLQLAGILEGDVPELGNSPGNEHVELATLSVPPDRYGIELAFAVAGVHASYDAASRGGSDLAPASGDSINVTQLSFAANFWHTKRFKISANVSDYYVPGSGSSENLAVVPANLGPTEQRTPDHSLWEVGLRTMLGF